MPEESVDLVQYVMENCENLDFKGLMTIGQMGHSYDERGSNPDFLVSFSEFLVLWRKELY